jgi:tetratricopeptide (TPR) repeat protein
MAPASSAAGVLLAGLVLGGACGQGAEHVVPVPPRLAELDPRMSARITAAVEAVRAAPEDAARWLALGMTYEANDLFALAIQGYRTALELAPDGKTWHRLACAEAGRGDWAAAAEAMRCSLELTPAYAPSHWRLGNYLFDLGDFPGAERAYAEAARLDPEHLGGPLGLARVYLQQGEPGRAIEVLEAVRHARPDERAPLSLLHSAYLQAGRGADAAAIDGLQRPRASLGKDPWYREFREYWERPQMERALELLQSGKAAEAAALLEVFTAERPDDLNASAYLALAYAQLGRAPEARAVIEQVLAREPENLHVLRVLADLEERAGNMPEVLATLARIVAIDPNDAQALRRKGRIETVAGRSADALDSLTRAFALDQREPAQLVDIGALQLAQGQVAEAVASFERARRAGVEQPSLTLGLARAWGKAGRRKEAIALLEGASGLGRSGEVLLAELRAAEAEGGR